MTSSAVFSLRLALASLAGVAVLMAGLGAASAGAAEPIKGSMVPYNVALEKKKCKSKKGKAKAKCLRSAKARGVAATRKMMSTPNGRYGFGIRQAAIPGRPGTLIWNKKVATTPGASRTDMVLYSSKSFPGDRKIVVSGTVSVPQGTPPVGGWPVITWAHGTTGLADKCAPSRGSDQGSYGGAEPLVEGWLEDGYAVVATDYEGLGTPGIHPYLVGDSEGRGVIDIVVAARAVNPKISKKAVIAGHSQGGHAALFAAELAPTWGAGIDYEGTVAYAPASNLAAQASNLGIVPPDAYGLSALATSILRGAVAANPAIDPRDILTEDAYQQYAKTESLCLGELGEAFAGAGTGPGELLKPTWSTGLSGEAFQQVLTEMNPEVSVDEEVLIPQGLEDTTVLPFFTTILVGQLRAINDPSLIDYVTYGNTGSPNVPTDGPSTHSSILLDADGQVDDFLRGAFGLPPLP